MWPRCPKEVFELIITFISIYFNMNNSIKYWDLCLKARLIFSSFQVSLSATQFLETLTILSDVQEGKSLSEKDNLYCNLCTI